MLHVRATVYQQHTHFRPVLGRVMQLTRVCNSLLRPTHFRLVLERFVYLVGTYQPEDNRFGGIARHNVDFSIGRVPFGDKGLINQISFN